MNIVNVALEVLREALNRKWFLGIALGISVFMILLWNVLQFEIVDGALAATQLFGDMMGTSIQSADVALRPVFRAASYVIYYGVLLFGIAVCAPLATTLLAPGRIDYLLALPIARWELILGSYMGVLVLTLGGTLYGAAGFMTVLGLKTGIWSTGILIATSLSSVTFAAIYAAMLTTAVFVRYTPVIIIAGLCVLMGGILASNIEFIQPEIETLWLRDFIGALSHFIPRVARVSHYAADIAGDMPIEPAMLIRSLTGMVFFGLSMLCLGLWHFERKDF
jgi:ABC-type transport system involved in multi-copper enzyme maturation permease subunit